MWDMPLENCSGCPALVVPAQPQGQGLALSPADSLPVARGVVGQSQDENPHWPLLQPLSARDIISL